MSCTNTTASALNGELHADDVENVEMHRRGRTTEFSNYIDTNVRVSSMPVAGEKIDGLLNRVGSRITLRMSHENGHESEKGSNADDHADGSHTDDHADKSHGEDHEEDNRNDSHSEHYNVCEYVGTGLKSNGVPASCDEHKWSAVHTAHSTLLWVSVAILSIFLLELMSLFLAIGLDFLRRCARSCIRACTVHQYEDFLYLV